MFGTILVFPQFKYNPDNTVYSAAVKINNFFLFDVLNIEKKSLYLNAKHSYDNVNYKIQLKMSDNFNKVKEYLLELEYSIVSEDADSEIFVIEKEEEGIVNLVINCESPILVVEQVLFEVKKDNMQMYKLLLQKNRDIIHGAFALDDNGKKMLFRDTLQLENLDLNELEGTLNSLSLLLSEYADKIIEFSKLK